MKKTGLTLHKVSDMQYLFDITIYGPDEVHGELCEVRIEKGKFFIKPKSISRNGFPGYELQRFVINPNKVEWLINHVNKITEDSQSDLEFSYREAMQDLYKGHTRARGKKKVGGYVKKDKRVA